MLSVIETGGKQYVVKSGQMLKIEKIAGDAGQAVTFDSVLLTANDDGSTVSVGTPYLSGASVKAEIVEQGRGQKIRVVKYKRKVRYKRARGHRQHYTKVKIVS